MCFFLPRSGLFCFIKQLLLLFAGCTAISSLTEHRYPLSSPHTDGTMATEYKGVNHFRSQRLAREAAESQSAGRTDTAGNTQLKTTSTASAGPATNLAMRTIHDSAPPFPSTRQIAAMARSRDSRPEGGNRIGRAGSSRRIPRYSPYPTPRRSTPSSQQSSNLLVLSPQAQASSSASAATTTSNVYRHGSNTADVEPMTDAQFSVFSMKNTNTEIATHFGWHIRSASHALRRMLERKALDERRSYHDVKAEHNALRSANGGLVFKLGSRHEARSSPTSELRVPRVLFSPPGEVHLAARKAEKTEKAEKAKIREAVKAQAYESSRTLASEEEPEKTPLTNSRPRMAGKPRPLLKRTIIPGRAIKPMEANPAGNDAMEVDTEMDIVLTRELFGDEPDCTGGAERVSANGPKVGDPNISVPPADQSTATKPTTAVHREVLLVASSSLADNGHEDVCAGASETDDSSSAPRKSTFAFEDDFWPPLPPQSPVSGRQSEFNSEAESWWFICNPDAPAGTRPNPHRL